jgi:hypothetical protein
MDAVSSYMRGLKMIFAVASMLLVTHTMSAQQEVAPDHFDGSDVRVQMATRAKAPKRVAKQKPAHAAKKTASKKDSASSASGK